MLSQCLLPSDRESNKKKEYIHEYIEKSETEIFRIIQLFLLTCGDGSLPFEGILMDEKS